MYTDICDEGGHTICFLNVNKLKSSSKVGKNATHRALGKWIWALAALEVMFGERSSISDLGG